MPQPNVHVALHGLTGSGPLLRNQWNIANHAYVPTLPGHVDSLYNINSVVPDIHAFENISRLILTDLKQRYSHCIRAVGYSLGGRLLLGMMALEPDFFEEILLVSAHVGLSQEHEKQARMQSDEQWAQCLEQQGIEAFAQAWEAQPLWHSLKHAPEERVQAQERVRRLHEPKALAHMLRCTSLGRMPCYASLLQVYAQRIRFFAGALDTKFTQLGLLLNQHYGLRCTVLAGVGHSMPVEAPHFLNDNLENG